MKVLAFRIISVIEETLLIEWSTANIDRCLSLIRKARMTIWVSASDIVVSASSKRVVYSLSVLDAV